MSDYVEEIRKIMYVCGDCSQPSPVAASLIEGVTQQQIVQLAVRAMEGAKQRSLGSEVTIIADDIFFLMRRDKEKVKRLLCQIDLAEKASTSQNGSGGMTVRWWNQYPSFFISHSHPPPFLPPFPLCLPSSLPPSLPPSLFLTSRSVVSSSWGEGRWSESEFLTDLLGSDSLNSEDEVQLQQHRDSRTREMDSTEYTNYVNCRQVNFVKNLVRFQRWLNLESVLDHSPTNDIIEILACLAYDTVRELVELSLLVKQDMEKNHGDPISPQQLLVLPSSHPHTMTSPHPHPPHRTPQQLASPSASGVSQEATGTSSGGSGETTRQSRGRKRKKSVSTDVSGSHDSVPDQSGVEHDHHSQNGLGTDKSGRGIQPCHIREALRRLNVPSGPLLPLATHCYRPTYAHKTLCIW